MTFSCTQNQSPSMPPQPQEIKGQGHNWNPFRIEGSIVQKDLVLKPLTLNSQVPRSSNYDLLRQHFLIPGPPNPFKPALNPGSGDSFGLSPHLLVWLPLKINSSCILHASVTDLTTRWAYELGFNYSFKS